MLVAVADHERFMRDGDDLVTVIDVPAPRRRSARQVTITDLHDGEVTIEVPAGHPARRGDLAARRRNAEPAPPRAQRQPARGRQRDHPAPLSKEQRALLKQLADSIGEENLRHDETLVGKLRRLFTT